MYLYISFYSKKYSHRLINLRLSHCSHFLMIYLITFLGQQVSIPQEAYGGVRQLSDFIKNILVFLR